MFMDVFSAVAIVMLGYVVVRLTRSVVDSYRLKTSYKSLLELNALMQRHGNGSKHVERVNDMLNDN